MAGTGWRGGLASSGILVFALALPEVGLGAIAQPTAVSQARAVLPDRPAVERSVFRPEPQRREPASGTTTTSAPKPYELLASEPKPYAMLLAGLALILFIARRRTRARNAGS